MRLGLVILSALLLGVVLVLTGWGTLGAPPRSVPNSPGQPLTLVADANANSVPAATSRAALVQFDSAGKNSGRRKLQRLLKSHRVVLLKPGTSARFVRWDGGDQLVVRLEDGTGETRWIAARHGNWIVPAAHDLRR